MTSATTEPPTLRSMPPFSSAAASSNRRSYSCYNCNYSFYIIPTPSTSDSSPDSFRCPYCHHRHLIPHHTISMPLSPPPPPPPEGRSSDYASGYRSSGEWEEEEEEDEEEEEEEDEEEEDEEEEEEEEGEDDYDSDNSLVSFTPPSNHSSSPALKSFVASLPIKNFAPNSPPALPSCSICMEDFDISPEASLEISELPCEHYFHKNCVVEWLQRSNTCPLCRYELPVDGSPEEEEGYAEAGTDGQEVEYEAVLVLDLSNREEIVGSNAEALRGSDDGLVSNMNGRGTSGLAFDGIPGEDGLGRGDEERVSNSATSGSGGLAGNGRMVSGLEFDPMRDEDGDTFMVDA